MENLFFRTKEGTCNAEHLQEAYIFNITRITKLISHKIKEVLNNEHVSFSYEETEKMIHTLEETEAVKTKMSEGDIDRFTNHLLDYIKIHRNENIRMIELLSELQLSPFLQTISIEDFLMHLHNFLPFGKESLLHKLSSVEFDNLKQEFIEYVKKQTLNDK